MAICAALIVGVMIGGCSATLPGLSTGSLFGGAATTPATAPVAQNDPVSRAMQVGTTAARAQKCGYNFDALKLRTQFLATESAALTNPADIANVGKVYDVSFNGVSKAVAAQGEEYCSEVKTRKIKEALTRHLAGDYTPTPPEPVVPEEGLFGALGSNSGPDKGPMKTPLDDY